MTNSNVTLQEGSLINSVANKVGDIERSLLIRWSTNEDIQKINKWLREEEALNVHGNFLCNWRLTKKHHKEGKLLVLFDETENIPIAYQWGQLLQSGILQVRKEWRRKGLGRLVVQHCVELALEKDEMVLNIECKPSTSIPFWKAMDFTIVEGEGDNSKAYRLLSKQLMLPLNGTPQKVRISIYPEEKKWEKDVFPTKSYSPEAILSNDGKVYLAERVVFPNGLESPIGDLVIEILVGSKIIYLDKAKYQDAQNYGVRRCSNGFYVDVVTI